MTCNSLTCAETIKSIYKRLTKIGFSNMKKILQNISAFYKLSFCKTFVVFYHQRLHGWYLLLLVIKPSEYGWTCIISSLSWTPNFWSTFSLAKAMWSSMSWEVEPPAFMKKLAWMLEIIAPSSPKPFNPAFSINSAATTPNSDGFLNTEPALRSPSGWVSFSWKWNHTS